MTTQSTQPAPRSRRALLAGAIGGLGVWAASAIGRAAPAEAAAGDPIRMGQVNNAGRTTTELEARLPYQSAALKVRQFGDGQGINAVGKNPVVARVPDDEPLGTAVVAQGGELGVAGSGTAIGVFGHGLVGVEGRATRIGKRLIGVLGVSIKGKGVSGETERGKAVHGRSRRDGWAGDFEGRVFTSRYIELGEVPGPQPPDAGHARFFVRDNGAGKVQLCVRFPTGAVQVIATEP